jgi:GNAT superfamily N-acetyltransferase
MPQIEVRSAVAQDIPSIMEIDHDYTSEYVWQLDMQAVENGEIHVNFRQVHLPRSIKVEYPRSRRRLPDDWLKWSGILVAVLDQRIIGYASLMMELSPDTTWISDLVVNRPSRRQGVGSALILASEQWAEQHGSVRLVMEMQPKNYPAICLARKQGFEFCGYHDQFYPHHEIALFFSKMIR